MERKLKVHIITLSDRAIHGIYEDKTRYALAKYIKMNSKNSYIIDITLIPSEKDEPQKVINGLIKEESNFITTTGSTIVSNRNIVPNAILPLIKRMFLGFEEDIHIERSKTSNYYTCHLPYYGKLNCDNSEHAF